MKLQGVVFCVSLAIGAPMAARADEKADRLIEEAAAKTASVRSLTGTLTLVEKGTDAASNSTGTVKLVKPNKALIVITGKTFGTTIASDGKTVTTLMPNNQYTKATAAPNGSNVGAAWALPVATFFDLKSGLGVLGNGPMSYEGQQTVGGTTYDVLARVSENNTVRYFVAPNRLVTRTSIEFRQGKLVYSLTAELMNVKLNALLTAADLTFALPKTAKLYEPPDYNAKLLPVGKLAEKFDLVALKTDHVTFDDAARGKKAVLVNFWFYG